jgi:hypothetical protein
MNLEDPKIKAAFIRGYMNKCAEHGLDKTAWLNLLAPIIGGLGGDLLLSRLATGPLLRMAGKTLQTRRAAALAAGHPEPAGLSTKLLKFFRAPIPGTGMRTGQAIGSTLGFGLGGAAGSALAGGENPQPQQQVQQYNEY